MIEQRSLEYHTFSKYACKYYCLLKLISWCDFLNFIATEYNIQMEMEMLSQSQCRLLVTVKQMTLFFFLKYI